VREYEVTIIVKPDLDDEARSQVIERVTNWLAPGASEEKRPLIEHWGQKNLAYPIRKYAEGYYVYFEVQLDPSALREIERNILYVDDILRHLVVRKQL
jgi:small subunit ribosomal protein S6